jgi:hypothetical protein
MQLSGDGSSGNDANDDLEDQAEVSDLENPYAESYLPSIARVPTMRDMAASYIYSLTVAAVRKHAKALGSKQYNMSRAQLRGTLLSVAAKKVAAGEAAWDNIFGEDFVEYVTNPAQQTRSWNMAPSDAALEMFKPEHVGDRRRRAFRADAANADTIANVGPSLTFSEFARLVCILLQVHSVRTNLLDSGHDLTRGQSNRRVGRDEF